jgi:hypothetical protein
MFNNKKEELDIQEMITRNRREIEILEERYSKLAEETNILYEKLGITKEELKKYLADPSNFSPQAWKDLQKYKERLHEAYERDIEIIQNATDKEKRFKALNIPKYSIFVR